MLWTTSTFIFCILFSYCTENEPNRDLKTEVRTEPRFLRTVTPLINTYFIVFQLNSLLENEWTPWSPTHRLSLRRKPLRTSSSRAGRQRPWLASRKGPRWGTGWPYGPRRSSAARSPSSPRWITCCWSGRDETTKVNNTTGVRPIYRQILSADICN